MASYLDYTSFEERTFYGLSTASNAFNGGGLSLGRGMSDWADCVPSDPALREQPMISVSTATDLDWRLGREQDKETWVYFHNRQSWLLAYRFARILLRQGGSVEVSYDFGFDVGRRLGVRVIPGARHRILVHGWTPIWTGTFKRRPQ